MRVIDIDPILAWANDPEVHEPYGVRGSELMRKLWDAPTIDAVSVVHGEWIEHKKRTIVMDNNFVDFFPTEFECSNCGLRRATYFINSPLSNYCPNCGAKMDGGRKTND